MSEETENQSEENVGYDNLRILENIEVNLTVEVHDSSANTIAGIAQKIPVPTGSSFVISDAGKTLLEAQDSIRVYCDTANAIDVNLSILTGVS